MINEALACGVPVVSFKIGISNDVIRNNFNGYLATDISKKLGDRIIEITKVKTNHLKQMKKCKKNCNKKF